MRERRQPRAGRRVQLRSPRHPRPRLLRATTPRQKRERIRAIGGDAVEILVRGSTYDETSAIAIEEAAGAGAS
ncbi:MAG TPA: hypothetical protein VHD81_03950 [Mycobacteriales bacterium]|nr:hypothetical protein [Mycobacteriales bacterium]